jgi:hypothetical protein
MAGAMGADGRGVNGRGVNGSDQGWHTSNTEKENPLCQ